MFLLLIVWWIALGENYTFSVVEFVAMLEGSNSLVGRIGGVGIAAVLVTLWYFLGHILLWLSRSGNPNESVARTGYKRAWYTLTFRIPKLSESFDPKLERLFNLVRKKFSSGEDNLEWREFYPIAKVYLSQNVPTSLVATYQNKYTLHRSIAMIGAILFWISLLALLVAYYYGASGGWSPKFSWLWSLSGFGCLLVWNFSSSYLYYWQMFGNTIITETYSQVYGPRT